MLGTCWALYILFDQCGYWAPQNTTTYSVLYSLEPRGIWWQNLTDSPARERTACPNSSLDNGVHFLSPWGHTLLKPFHFQVSEQWMSSSMTYLSCVIILCSQCLFIWVACFYISRVSINLISPSLSSCLKYRSGGPFNKWGFSVRSEATLPCL